MPRSCKRKSEISNIASDTVLRDVRTARLENRSIRSWQEILESPFSLRRDIAAELLRIHEEFHRIRPSGLSTRKLAS
jgi:hypothetical protein